MTGTPDDDARRNDGLQPWQVPFLPEDALTEDLPAEVAAAARRVLNARRPGVTVAELCERRVEPDGTVVFCFDDAGVIVELRVSRVQGRSLLQIASAACPAGEAEVLHGSAADPACPRRIGLRDLSNCEDGLVSVVLSPASRRSRARPDVLDPDSLSSYSYLSTSRPPLYRKVWNFLEDA